MYLHFSGRQYSSPTPHLPFYYCLEFVLCLFGVSFSESTFGAKLYFFSFLNVKQITFPFNKFNSFTFRCISVVIFASKVCKKMQVSQAVHDIVRYQVSE